MEAIRINRYLAMCGLGSRRMCEQLVADGRVTINGDQVTGLGERVSPTDRVLVDGEAAKPERELVVLLNKPRGVVCTRSDPQSRQTIYDILPKELKNLAHVGRLDRESEGMLVLTNAGDLAHRLTHPASKVEKEYLVQVDKAFDIRDRQRLLDGIALEEGMAYAVAVEQMAPRLLRLVLQQGIKRQIRLMLDSLGYEVRQLVRTRIGSLIDTKLKSGKWRRLNPIDLELLQNNPAGRGKPGKKAPGGKSIPGIIPPPPPTAKSRRPAVQAAASGGRRSPDSPVRGTASAKLGETRRPAAKKSSTGRGKPGFGKPVGKSSSQDASESRSPAGKQGRRPASKSRRPAGKGRAPTNTGRTSAGPGRSPAGKTRSPAGKSRSPAGKAGSKSSGARGFAGTKSPARKPAGKRGAKRPR